MSQVDHKEVEAALDAIREMIRRREPSSISGITPSPEAKKAAREAFASSPYGALDVRTYDRALEAAYAVDFGAAALSSRMGQQQEGK